MTKEIPNEMLLRQFEVVKRQEDLITAKRRDLAAQITKAFGHEEANSSWTYKDVPNYKVTIKIPLNSRIDWGKWAEIENDFLIDGQDFRPIEMKPIISDSAVRWLQANRPDLYVRLAEVLTVTPGMPQVKVEHIEKETK